MFFQLSRQQKVLRRLPTIMSQTQQKLSFPVKRDREDDTDENASKVAKTTLGDSHPYTPDKQYKFMSWNVNGFSALWKKDKGKWLKDLIAQEQPSILGLQETKLQGKNEDTYRHIIEGYKAHFNSCTAKNGYSGTAVYIRNDITPIKVTHGINIDKHDDEGRMITVELPECYYITSYVPNSGQKLERLKYRTEEWDHDVIQYLIKLQETKPVVWCGDLNVAILDIDVHNPKGNKKTAGFTDEERKSFRRVLDEHKFTDSFRHFNADKAKCYTYWGYRHNAREQDKGWRLDYFITSHSIQEKLKESYILKDVMGSDHCPIALVVDK